MSTVLVTGGSGFIGIHCILQLLQAGHDVRTTVRNLERATDVQSMLARAGVTAHDRLKFIAADLLRDAGWNEAAKRCDYVLHVASPFPMKVPRNADELVIPAREGTLRVLGAARDEGVKRVVLTSSFAAIGYGQKTPEGPFDETYWTNPDAPDVQPYVKSKTLAEKAAWEFISREGKGLELSVVNPVAVFGPVLGPDYSTSIQLVKRLMEGSLPGCPRLSFGVVDVRDVADLHLRVMTNPAANGERFLAVAEDFVSMQGVAKILKRSLGASAKRVPTREIPDWILRIAAIFDPSVRQVLPELGRAKNGTNAKAKRILGWSPRTNEEAVIATAESLLQLGLLKR